MLSSLPTSSKQTKKNLRLIGSAFYKGCFCTYRWVVPPKSGATRQFLQANLVHTIQTTATAYINISSEHFRTTRYRSRMRQKKINWQGGGKKSTLTNNLENGGCGRQNEFQPFSTTPVNGSLSNYYGLCLLEERKNLGQCRVRFVLSQESFSWRIHCFRWTGGVCALC